MEQQYRRGIYRPNAQRLSISLAPLVAQRSLLFRVKADLATKTNYGELTPTEDSDSASSSASVAPSPALFVVTASASARIISAALSALSTCSVYSQDSWQGGPSPFRPVPAAGPVVPTRAPAGLLLNVNDTRRHAIAFSPSVQWESLSDDADSEAETQSNAEVRIQTPLKSVSTIPALSVTIPVLAEFQVNPKAHLRLSTSSSVLSPFFRGGSPAISLEDQTPVNMSAIESEAEAVPAVAVAKKRASAAKRISKHAKAFSKAMGHLSMQPSSKKDSRAAASALRRQTAMVITHLHRSEGIVEQEARESLNTDIAPVRPRPPRSIRLAPKEVDSSSNTIPLEMKNSRSITPPPPIAAPAPITVTPARKGHRRYNSSPAVPHFNSSDFKGWNRTDMPPMPALPPKSELEKFKLGNAPPPRPPRSLERANSVGRGHVRAVSVDCS